MYTQRLNGLGQSSRCFCRLLDYFITIINKATSFPSSVCFVKGDGELFCQNLSGIRKKKNTTTNLPFIAGCFEVSTPIKSQYFVTKVYDAKIKVKT